jgi:hypothetical protein
MTDSPQQQKRQEQRERQEVARAQAQNKGHTYIDEDGCEVTITAGGRVFYNAADWY